MAVQPTRRWLRFSLRTLLVQVTAFCIWLGWQARIVHQRNAAIAEIEAAGGQWISYSAPEAQVWDDSVRAWRPEIPNSRRPFWLRWMGDDEVYLISWPNLDQLPFWTPVGKKARLLVTAERQAEIKRLFPETHFLDKHIDAARRYTWRRDVETFGPPPSK